MCIEDIAISRRCSVRTEVLTSGVTLDLPANVQRLALYVASTGGDGVCEVRTRTTNGFATVGFAGSMRAAQGVIGTVEGRDGIEISFRTHPGVIHEPLQVYAGIGGGVAVIVEMMPELAQLVNDKLSNWKAR